MFSLYIVLNDPEGLVFQSAMKAHIFLTAFAAMVYAVEEVFQRRDVFLMVESDLPALNGSWLHIMFGVLGRGSTLADQTKVRASIHCRDASPVVVSAYHEQPLQLQLNPWDINYDLGLRSERVGFHSLVNLYEPNDTKVKAFGKSTEWSVFTLDKDGYLGVNDGLDVRHRKWMVDLDDPVTEDVESFELNGGSNNSTFDNYSFGLWDGKSQANAYMN